VCFFGRGPGQGQIPGHQGHGPKIPDRTIDHCKQLTYVQNFSSLGDIAAEKEETDERTDGRHNDFSRAHFIKCALKINYKFQFFYEKSQKFPQDSTK
jgi:hypothetical protein